MKMRLVSIILTVFLVLSMMPFAAFADDTIVCPACGGSVTKQERRLLTAHDDFYKCDKCGKWAWVNKLGSLSLFSVGDQQILDAADSSAIINFSFNNGKLIPAEKAPSGIGRKDLPGYADDNGTPNYNNNGAFQVVIWPDIAIKSSSNPFNSYPYSFNFTENNYYVTGNNNSILYNYTASSNGYYLSTYLRYSLKCKVNGLYYVENGQEAMSHIYNYNTKEFFSSDIWPNAFSKKLSAGSETVLLIREVSTSVMSSYKKYTAIVHPLVVTCIPDTITINNYNTITINNNTWNGNIYVDNSNNLTYIYPQYTTINEKNETVTNISTNPIIYNNETKKYYTYDTITNNYYYINYETPAPIPTPSPSPAPAPTWTPGGGATRGGGVGRHPSDTDAADWTLHYYVLNNRRYDAYYALKKTEVDTDTKLPWVDNKKYISTTQIPIANGQYTVSVPDGVYWRVWSWDEVSHTLTGVNSSNWHSTINNFLFNATGEYIFEFCKADGSDFNTAKDVTLKLKNDKITDYEDGGTIVEEPTPSPSPGPTETPSPTEPPIPTATPKPGGGTVPTPGGDSSGGNSGSSDSGWNPFKWLTDLLKDLIEDILKGLWKLLTSIFGFILWLLSLLFKLFPWMPNSGILALCAGVVVVTVIRIIKFITGR